MKFLKIIFITCLLATTAFAQNLTDKERGDRASLSLRLANNYTKQTAATLPQTLNADIDAFVALSLTERNDLQLVKNVLKVLLILDAPESEGGDPSRTNTIVVAQSYKKHPALFEKAMKQIETKANYRQLKEFKDIFVGRGNN